MDGALPTRPPAMHFLKDSGPDQETTAATPPVKCAVGRDAGWGFSAGAERPIIGKIMLGLSFSFLSATRVLVSCKEEMTAICYHNHSLDWF